MAEEFAIKESSGNVNTAVLRVEGRLDARNSQTLFFHCKRVLSGGRRHILINLSRVSFVASSGIGTLLALTEEFHDAGGGIHLVELSDAVRSVVDLLNLTQFLSIGRSEADMMATIEA
jgi:anti-anti-sigma factor